MITERSRQRLLPWGMGMPRRAGHLLLLVVLMAASSLGFAQLPAPDDPASELSLEAAVATALASNPGLAGTRARAAAMADVPSQAGSLPDPMLRLDAMSVPVDSFSRTQEPMTQLQVGIEQELPFPGKLGLQQRAAERDADVAASAVDEARLSLVYDVQKAWWQICYLDHALEIASRNHDLLSQFVKIAQTRYEVGEGLQQEVLLAQVEMSKLLDRQIELDGLRSQQVAQLNALLNRGPAMPLRLPRQLDEQLPGLLPEQQLYSRAVDTRPLLAQKRFEVEAARTRHELARRERYPDFSLGASYGFRAGHDPDGSARSDLASVGVAVNLPLYAGNKQDKAVSQRGSELQQQQYALQDELARVQGEISAAIAEYRRASEQVQLYHTGIIPQSRQSVASMLSGYQVNKVDFLNLVRAQITLYEYETQYWKAFAEAHQALARLTAAVGEGVTRE